MVDHNRALARTMPKPPLGPGARTRCAPTKAAEAKGNTVRLRTELKLTRCIALMAMGAAAGPWLMGVGQADDARKIELKGAAGNAMLATLNGTMMMNLSRAKLDEPRLMAFAAEDRASVKLFSAHAELRAQLEVEGSAGMLMLYGDDGRWLAITPDGLIVDESRVLTVASGALVTQPKAALEGDGQ